ncbi:recombinase family protein [Streptomyces sp. NPDC056002]|uniref:recombinase family protein n=1 Tax=Streptomyces sp. NPDC056002 TaxID=3345675 RepID=UPI0035E2F007
MLYGRVSSHRQRAKGDVDRQMVRLRQAAGDRIVVGEFFDVASGLSDKRKGLRRGRCGRVRTSRSRCCW